MSVGSWPKPEMSVIIKTLGFALRGAEVGGGGQDGQDDEQFKLVHYRSPSAAV